MSLRRTKSLRQYYDNLMHLIASKPVRESENHDKPEDLFDVIVGYEDVKKLVKMSLESKEQTSILLIGVPASAKSLFLLECARLPNAFYILGASTSKAGLADQLFRLEPEYLLIDELEKMNREDLTVLLSLMETGIVKEVKYGKTREIVLSTKVYGACNETEKLPPEILSRFHFKLHFKPYTRKEFITIATTYLAKQDIASVSLAEYIAMQVAEYSRDVRDAIGIAKIAKNQADVDFLLGVRKEYSESCLKY